MTYTIWGWYEGDLYRARVRTLTAPMIEHPEMPDVYRRVLEQEFIPQEASMDANPDSFTRVDFAEDDETVPESERGYSYMEMTT